MTLSLFASRDNVQTISGKQFDHYHKMLCTTMHRCSAILDSGHTGGQQLNRWRKGTSVALTLEMVIYSCQPRC